MTMNYVDEFLHAIGDDFDGVCMYWKMLMLMICVRTYALSSYMFMHS